MPGFGSLYVGVSGLQTAQNALNTTAHNLANVETEGYVRQQILQGDKQYNKIGYASVSNMQVGLGVNLSDVRQVRDEFLDKEYRKETGRAGFYNVCYEAAAELEGFFQELDGASYQVCLKELWQSIAELEKDPTKVDKEYFVLKASEFLQRSVAINDSMKEYLTSSNDQFMEICKKIALAGYNLGARNITPTKYGCKMVATIAKQDSWMNVRQQVFLILFFRESDLIEDTILRKSIEEMKSQNYFKCIVCTCSGFTRTAMAFAENRPFELVPKEKLEVLLAKAKI